MYQIVISNTWGAKHSQQKKSEFCNFRNYKLSQEDIKERERKEKEKNIFNMIFKNLDKKIKKLLFFVNRWIWNILQA